MPIAREVWEAEQRDYPPERVRYLVEHWAEVCARAETPDSSAHLSEPEHRKRNVPCPEPLWTGARDWTRGADVQADIEQAWACLPVGSVERRVVALRMATSYVRRHPITRRRETIQLSLGEIARLLRTRKRSVCEAYDAGLVAMAGTLGWVEPEAWERLRREQDSG